MTEIYHIIASDEFAGICLAVIVIGLLALVYLCGYLLAKHR